MIERLNIVILLLVCVTLCGEAHTLYIDKPIEPDSTVIELNEIDVSYTDPSKSIKLTSERSMSLGAKALRNLTTFMGQADPIHVMQSLPSIASSDIISGGIYVQGCENSHNFITIDGGQVYNPSHLFGLFSIFNTPHFNTFDISTDYHCSTDANYIGAAIRSSTSDNLPYRMSVDANIGIIESHITIRTPVKSERSALTFSGRITYLNALFGNSLKLENAPIHYHLSDWNATYLHLIKNGWKLKISGYYGKDNMRLPDPNYASVLNLGWTNALLSTSLSNSDMQRHTIAFSAYSNKFNILYSDINRNLPSQLSDYSYTGFYQIKNIDLAALAHIRTILPQLPASGKTKTKDLSAEISLGADWHMKILSNLHVEPGIKFSAYSTKSFHRLYPLPSLNSTFRLNRWMTIGLNISRLAQYTHKIEESTMGLPSDYWIAANKHIKPMIANCGVAKLSGEVLNGFLSYSLSGYYRDIRHMTDWCGLLFNILSDSYDPNSDIVIGKGHSWGIASLLSFTVRNFHGWLSYNYGKSQINVAGKNPGWQPTSHDRTHDLNLSLSWILSNAINISASWVYATGRPYTEPLYGYIIGENLICEFKPLNSSRLPAMHRLDMSLNWTFLQRKNLRQGINVSLYNAYRNANTLFVSFDYSPDKGFYKKHMDFKAIIPYISYYLNF